MTRLAARLSFDKAVLQYVLSKAATVTTGIRYGYCVMHGNGWEWRIPHLTAFYPSFASAYIAFGANAASLIRGSDSANPMSEASRTIFIEPLAQRPGIRFYPCNPNHRRCLDDRRAYN